MYSKEELDFLASERSNDKITGCLVCEYGHSKCTCSDNEEEEYFEFDDYGDGLSGCKNCGTDCIGEYCNSCSYQAMVDKFS
ncbi:hypothetical protein [Runella zeae]|uniref:hypothetical protein n=1 Tax=Runella zeae TaxID=94255 RepID=UPI0023553732|nr:hypothetical protein [Runella zeae]